MVGQEWLSDEALKAYPTGFPAGTSSNAPLSLNAILGAATVGSNLVWSFVKMSPYDYLFLRSRCLTIESQDPYGRHDVIKMIPLSRGIGSVEQSATPEGV